MIQGREINITLDIMGTRYPLTILGDDEEFFRTAEKAVQDRLAVHRAKHPTSTPMEWLVFVLIDYVVAAYKLEKSNEEMHSFIQGRLELLRTLMNNGPN